MSICLEQAQHKKLLKRYRNETIAWVVSWGCIITAGYEFTSGWLGPVSTYLGFAIGLVLLMVRSMSFIHKHSVNISGEKMSNRKIVINYLCLAGAIVTGFTGLVIGLFNSGRLIL